MTKDERKELVERLRENAGPSGEWGEKADVLQLEAANEIERLSVDFATLQYNMHVVERQLTTAEVKLGRIRALLSAEPTP